MTLHGIQTLCELVDRNAHLHGEDSHSVFGGKRVSFSQYRARALRLASAVHRRGLRSQDRVSILAMNCAEFLEVIGVAEVAPYILAPLNYRLAAPEIAYQLRDAAPRLLFF